jgi:hypothetical protein
MEMVDSLVALELEFSALNTQSPLGGTTRDTSSGGARIILKR